MRMIVEAFKDTLELGLEKPKQVVVRRSLAPSIIIAGVPGSPRGSGAPSRALEIAHMRRRLIAFAFWESSPPHL